MPLRIPFTSLVVTGHRGTTVTQHQDNPLVRAVTGQPKDDWAVLQAAHPFLLPRPKPRGTLPVISLKRMTDFTRFVDAQALTRASRRTTRDFTRSGEVAAAVMEHVGRRLHTRLMFVGEDHAKRTSLMLNLATIASVRDRNAVVLLERPRADVDDIVRQAARLDELLESDPLEGVRTVQSALESATHFGTMFDILVAYAAGKAGARVGGFDERHRQASHKQEREAAMEAAIRGRLDTAEGPVVVLMGASHLAYMHDHFEGDVDFVALTTIVDAFENPPSAEHRKRASYLFANDDILKIRATRALETAPFDALTFAGGLVDLSPTPRPPRPQRYGVPGPSGTSGR